MYSEVDFEKMFMYWTQDTKWMGMFNLEWIFIKDVPFREFKDILILMRFIFFILEMEKQDLLLFQGILKKFLWLKERK